MNSNLTRQDVDGLWADVAAGKVEREFAHRLAVPWVEFGEGEYPDPMVRAALTRMHGFDMAYFPDTPAVFHDGLPGVYARTLDEIGQDRVKWLEMCAFYDRDPEGWPEAIRTWVRMVENHPKP